MQLPILFGAPLDVRAEVVADLLARDHEVLRSADLSAALTECRRCLPAAAVLPYPRGAGEDAVLRFLRERGRRTAVFLCADGAVFRDGAHRALAAGARAILDTRSPDFADDLGRRLKRLLRDARLHREEEEGLARLFARHHLVGTSAAMRDVFRRALKASRFNDLPVMIEGEKGTPKRRLAAALLYLDPDRVRMPFFALGCAGLGRVLGNLPGLGTADARGVAEQWHQLLRAGRGGTLFLDDIGALDRELQPILLAAARRRPPELRVIAATERPADELVGQGALDAELAAWLGLFRIPLPSLRGRPDDIAAQARHTLLVAGAERAAPVTDFGTGVLEALQRLPWEGNTTQLEGVVRRALAAKVGGTVLFLEDLPPWVREAPCDAPPPEPVPHPGDWAHGGDPMDVAAEDYERRLLRALLHRVDSDAEAVRPDHERSG